MTKTKSTASLNSKVTQDDKAKFAMKVKRLEQENSVLHGQIKTLNAELIKANDPIALSKSLYGALDSRIMRLFNKKGYRRNPKTGPLPVMGVRATAHDAAIQELLQLARQYDAKAFFRLNTAKADMKIHYRLAAKAYRSSRDLTVGLMRGSYRLYRKFRS